MEFWHWIDKDLNVIKEETEKNGVGIAGFLGGDTVHSMIRPEHKASYLEYLERSVEAAKLVGAEGLIIQSNALNRDGVYMSGVRIFRRRRRSAPCLIRLRKWRIWGKVRNRYDAGTVKYPI